MLKTLTVHLTKPKYAPLRAVADGWAQDALRLANTVTWLQRAHADPTGEHTPPKLKDAVAATQAILATVMTERDREEEAALPFLTPELVKWMFATGCLSWSEKRHFAAVRMKREQIQGDR